MLITNILQSIGFFSLHSHRLDWQNIDSHRFVVIVRVNDAEKHSMDESDDQVLVDQF